MRAMQRPRSESVGPVVGPLMSFLSERRRTPNELFLNRDQVIFDGDEASDAARSGLAVGDGLVRCGVPVSVYAWTIEGALSAISCNSHVRNFATFGVLNVLWGPTRK